jgi:NAD(P)-dependent dehydrogenase (short-subunit alcohol dehydrogenase family)
MNLLEGRAVLVAGGGRGIGRACAEMLAAHGARVLVSDPGVTSDGQSIEVPNLAEQVAATIRERGGQAVGTSMEIGSKEDGERLIEACLEQFGSVDAVVVPAAILRDRMIFNMTQEEFDQVLSVNLVGVYWLVRAACELMRSHRYGRIVTFTSAAGLEGRGGTSNYAAAKMGVVGLTKAAAMDMSRYGVLVNCIAPRANTRLTQQVAAARPQFAIPLDPSKVGDPSDVAPIAVYLTSERCQVTGHVFFSMGTNLGVYPDFVPHRMYRGEARLDVDAVTRVVEGYLLAKVVEV